MLAGDNLDGLAPLAEGQMRITTAGPFPQTAGAAPSPPPCVSALEARDMLRAALVRMRTKYGDAPAGSIGRAMDTAQALSVEFDEEVPWFHQVRDVEIPTYCKGDQKWQELAGALFALRNEEAYKPYYDAVPGEAAAEALEDVGNYFKGIGFGVGAIALLVVGLFVASWFFRR